MFESLSATKYPDISFTLSDYIIERGSFESHVRMNGLLRIAGTERAVVIHGSIFRNPAGQLILRGERLIDVRTFGVKPPRRFLGLLRVDDEVTVHFEVVVRPLIDPLGMLMAAQ
jgi:polyisoprenoid-binding protein YceI